MGIKIKKDDRGQGQKLKPLTVKYLFAIPLVGIMNIIAMFSYFINPSTDGILWAKALFLIAAMAGVVFTYWGFAWNLVSAGRRVIVNPVFGKSREITYENIKKIVVLKKKKRDSMAHFTIIDRNDAEFVRVYPLMKNSGDFFTRLKQMNIPIEEIRR